MKSKFTLLIGIIVAIVLLTFMFTFQVRYDEVVVRTTFDEVTASSVKRDPGLYFRWPWPIQKVTRYSTLDRVLDAPLVEKQTQDKHDIIIRSFITWKIDDPAKFFVRLENVESAREKLRPILQETQSLVSQYKFSELVHVQVPETQKNIRLTAEEQEALRQLDRQMRHARAAGAAAGGTAETLAVEQAKQEAIRSVLLKIRSPEKQITLGEQAESVAARVERALTASGAASLPMDDLREFLDTVRDLDIRKVRLADLEQDALEEIRARVEAQDLGIDVLTFGIRRNVLPEAITPQVFERMKTDRRTLAENIRSSGKAEAQRIRSEADAAKNRVMSFVDALATDIRTEGEREAAEYLSVFAKDQPLAIALERFKTLEQMLKGNTTVVLSADQLRFENIFPNWLKPTDLPTEPRNSGSDASGSGDEMKDSTDEKKKLVSGRPE